MSGRGLTIRYFGKERDHSSFSGHKRIRLVIYPIASGRLSASQLFILLSSLSNFRPPPAIAGNYGTQRSAIYMT